MSADAVLTNRALSHPACVAVSGIVRTEGESALTAALDGRGPDVAGGVAAVFLGRFDGALGGLLASLDEAQAALIRAAVAETFQEVAGAMAQAVARGSDTRYAAVNGLGCLLNAAGRWRRGCGIWCAALG
jgi:hypothetical protein